jgi:uncharacterized damage-inducible protein DinB
MLNYLLKLYSHEHWANAQLFGALSKAPAVPKRTQELCAHIMAAHTFWDKRLHGADLNFRTFGFFPSLSLDECAKLNEDFGTHWPGYLRSLPAPLESNTISFVGRDGSPLLFRVVDGLTQLHGHSIHHRAQIAVDMRAAGLEPVVTDYIYYCRINT